MKAFANSLHEAWLSGTTSFWTFIPECSFFATEGCFPESGSFDEFWTPSSEFQVAWKFYKQGVPWSFFSQQGNSEYRKDAKKQLHLHSEHPPIWYIGITSRHQKNHIMRLSSILLSPFRCSGSAWVLLSTINLNIQKGPKLVVLTGKKSKKSMQKHVPSRLAKSHVGGFFEYSKQRHSWEYDGCVGGWFSLSYFPDRWGELTGMIIMTEPWYRTSQIGENCQWKRKKTATKRYNRLRWSIIVLVDNIKQWNHMHWNLGHFKVSINEFTNSYGIIRSYQCAPEV